MNMRCMTRGHWWTPEHRYSVDTPMTNFACDDREVTTTYARRECRRCRSEDSITVDVRLGDTPTVCGVSALSDPSLNNSTPSIRGGERV